MHRTLVSLALWLSLGCASGRAPSYNASPAPVMAAPVAVDRTPVAAAPPTPAPTPTPAVERDAAVVITSPSPGWIAPSDRNAPEATAEAARAAVDAAPNVALARVTAAQEECSGLGGMHLRLEVLRVVRGANVRVLAAGAHGVTIPTGMQVVGSTWEVAFRPGAQARVTRGWCIDSLVRADANAIAIAAPR